jgi:hypothetical protein
MEQQNVNKQIELYREKEEDKLKYDLMELTDLYKEKSQKIQSDFEVE